MPLLMYSAWYLYGLLTMFTDSNTILIILSSVIILSYLFGLISNKLLIPSVVLLIGTGMALQLGVQKLAIEVFVPKTLLETLGTIGLILIVFEGSLDLKLRKEKTRLIVNSFISAIIILLLTASIICAIFYYLHGGSIQQCLVYATPFAVISSAIAIPSVSKLTDSKKEFIVYESTFSDIIGIMFFNYVIADSITSAESFLQFILNLVVIILISGVSSFLLLFLIDKVQTKVKFFLVIALLVLIYGIGKIFHLPSLLLILIFGLLLNNLGLVIKGKMAEWLHLERLNEVTEQFKMLTEEMAFLIRTFFFLLLGFSINFNSIIQSEVLLFGSLILAVIIIIRFLSLKIISQINVFPEFLIAPRGLITVILFYSIPEKFLIPEFNEGLLFFLIIGSSILMMSGLLLAGTEKQDINTILKKTNTP